MKTTAKDFERFKTYCREWIEVFGLLDYRVHYIHAGGQTGFGRCSTNSVSRSSLIKLCKDWGHGIDVTDEELRRTALHEVLHIIMNGTVELAKARWVQEEELDTAEEAAVTRLENAIFSLREKRR